MSRAQLLGLGLSDRAIKHRLKISRLHPVRRGVYAVGRAELTEHGQWMAAVLTCGQGAVLSHRSAGKLWGILPRCRVFEVTVPAPRHPKRPGIRIRKSSRLTRRDLSRCHRIPVTSPVRTLIDLGTVLTEPHLEAAVIAADKLDLVDPDALRAELWERGGLPGVPALRAILDAPTFAVTDSVLERRFLRIVRDAGLPPPETGAWVEGFKVDFLWRDVGLVVETDGLRYHRTPSQQARDHRRDGALAEAGFTPLRFTHAQVTREAAAVGRTLVAVYARLREEHRAA